MSRGCLLALVTAACLFVVGAVLVVVGLLGARDLRLTQTDIPLEGLPAAWDGVNVVQLTDIHHGPYVSVSQVRRVVELALSARPELIVLTGDYVSRRPEFIEPCFAALAELRAPLGLYAVLGNHDHWEGAQLVREAMARAGIVDLTNRSVRLQRGGEALWLAGVDDLWSGRPDLGAALAEVPRDGKTLLLTHHPDFTELIADHRVLLSLCGHTHGGQVVLPLLGPPVLPSSYGRKYASGLVVDGWRRVYVSRGTGAITPPLRLNCPPEVSQLRLTRAGASEGR